MLHQLWCESERNLSKYIRNVNNKTKDHISKHYSILKVHLATQMFSKHNVNTIDDYSEEWSGKEKYESFREVLLLLNDLIDIMNGRKKLIVFKYKWWKNWWVIEVCFNFSISNKKEYEDLW